MTNRNILTNNKTAMKQLKSWMLAAAIVCSAVAFMTGCKEAKANETNDEEAV